MIRVPVNDIRFASRTAKGVTIFNTAEGEKVVSVERISEPQEDEAPAGDAPAGDPPTSDQPAGGEPSSES